MTERPSRQTRRTEGARPQGRSARVVEAVLRATAEELGRVGYAGLRVEDVAARSGVNKTTIYRRWPSRARLVGAALRSLLGDREAPDTGTLRGDLLEAVEDQLAFARAAQGRGLLRVLQVERADPEIESIVRGLREEFRRGRMRIVERGIERGELPPGADPGLVVDLIFTPIYWRIFVYGKPVDEAWPARVVDTVLAGVRA